MGHAGALISNLEETAEMKNKVLKEAGAFTISVITEIPEILKDFGVQMYGEIRGYSCPNIRVPRYMHTFLYSQPKNTVRLKNYNRENIRHRCDDTRKVMGGGNYRIANNPGREGGLTSEPGRGQVIGKDVGQ
jgi:hypothetical protein